MPGPQDDKRPEYLIVGAGIAGCTLAYELCKRGRRVLLLEAGLAGREGASGVPVALANPYRGRSARASPNDLTGLAALRRLVAELAEAGLDSGWHSSGVLRIASNPKQAKLWRRREGVRWREPDELPAGYHAPYGGFLVEAGGYVEPRKLLDALLQAARHRGLGLREHCRVDALQPERESVRVEGSHGTFRADAVVLCVGASPNARLGLPRMERLAGDVIELDSNAELPYPLAGAVYGARSRDGVYVGGNHRPAGETDPDAPARLRQAASWFVPALRQAAISGVWTGVRAKTADHQPITGELRPGVWMLGALAGRGFLCSAQLAAQMADALEHRARP